MGFIKQFYQLDKVTSQKVSPLTIALAWGGGEAERMDDIYSIYVPNQRENKSLQQYYTLGVRNGFLPSLFGWFWKPGLDCAIIWKRLCDLRES